MMAAHPKYIPLYQPTISISMKLEVNINTEIVLDQTNDKFVGERVTRKISY